jgi:hypothetical protein
MESFDVPAPQLVSFTLYSVPCVRKSVRTSADVTWFQGAGGQRMIVNYLFTCESIDVTVFHVNQLM